MYISGPTIIIYFIILMAGGVVSQLDNESDEYLQNNIGNLNNVEPQLWLMRMTTSKRKERKPTGRDYDAGKDGNLERILREKSFNEHPPLPVYMTKAHILYESSWYSPDLPSVLILHDKCGDGNDVHTKEILKAFSMQNLQHHYNIFVWHMNGYFCNVVDAVFSELLQYDTDYPLALNQITAFLQTGIDTGKIVAPNINLIGLGISSQLAADIAINLNEKIASVIGLDPPIDTVFPAITTNNARHIQLYYTDESKYTTVTAREGSGIVHFFFTYEAEESNDPCAVQDPDLCIHTWCFKLFVAAVLVPRRFLAWKCGSLSRFERESRTCNAENTMITFPPHETPEGQYYIRVKRNFPYGVGADGRTFDRAIVNYNDNDEGDGVVYDQKYFDYMTPEELTKNAHLFRRRENALTSQQSEGDHDSSKRQSEDFQEQSSPQQSSTGNGGVKKFKTE